MATDPKAVRRAADLFKQVSDPTRLAVLTILGERGRNVTEIRAELPGMTQPAVSHHLALLRAGRLIESTRDGKFNVYGLTDAGRALAEAVGRVTG